MKLRALPVLTWLYPVLYKIEDFGVVGMIGGATKVTDHRYLIKQKNIFPSYIIMNNLQWVHVFHTHYYVLKLLF